MDDYNDEIMEEDDRKFGECPRCKQKATLTWFLGMQKGTDRIVSGWVCNKCFEKMRGKEDVNSV